MAFISIKSRHKLSGLINISGFHVDPGFYGKLKFSVYNAGTTDVILRYKEETFLLFIADVGEGVTLKKGEHWGQEHIEPKEMMPLLGTGIPFHNLARRLDTVETLVKIYGGILVAIFILLLTRIL
jgi:dCTP deaminase